MNNNSKIETLEEEKKKAEESLKTRMDEFNLLEVRNIQVNMRIICIENVFFCVYYIEKIQQHSP